MFSVFLSVHRGAPRSRSESRSGGSPLGQGPGGPWSRSRSWGAPWSRGSPLVKVQVKVWGPLVKFCTRTRGPHCQGLSQGLGAPWSRSRSGGAQVKVQVKVQAPPPCQGPKMRVAWAVRLLRSRRRTVLFIERSDLRASL